MTESFSFKSEQEAYAYLDFLGGYPYRVFASLDEDLPVKFFLSRLQILQTLGGRVGDHTPLDSRHDVLNRGLDLLLLA